MTPEAKVMVFDPCARTGEALAIAMKAFCAEAFHLADAEQLKAAIAQHAPTDVILQVPMAPPAEVLRLVVIVAEGANAHAIVIGPSHYADLPRECTRVGAAAYLGPESVLADLRAALWDVWAGKQYLGERFRPAQSDGLLRPIEPFCKLECQALKLGQEGKTTEEIARIEGVDVTVIEKRFTSMRKKLRMVGRDDLDWNRVACE